jgi:hypothetical protein
MEEWDPHVWWLCGRCQPTTNRHVLLENWQKLLHNVQSEKAKTNIPTNGEVDAALEDVVLEDTLDDGEDANEDWMTDNKDGEDSQGDDSRESGDGDVAQAQENKIQADTAINGNEE